MKQIILQSQLKMNNHHFCEEEEKEKVKDM